MLKNIFIYKLIIVLLVLSLGMTSIVFGEVEGSVNETAASFVVFYDSITDENIDLLASYDIAIIEPKGTNKSKNDFLQSSGTEIYGYMSTLQIEKNDEYKISKINETDYLLVNGCKVYIEKYDDYLGDIRLESFREVLIDIIEDRIVNAGYDGVFLDTVDFTEYFDDQNLNKELQMGYIVFLNELTMKFPELKIFQNRGFSSFELGASEYIDYLLFENFRSDKIIGSEYYSSLINRLNTLAIKNNVSIAALSEVNENFNRTLANQLKWSYHYDAHEENVSETYSLNNINYSTSEELFKMKIFLVSESDLNKHNLGEAVVLDKNLKPVMIYNNYLMDMNNELYINYLNDKFENAIKNNITSFKLNYVTSVEKVEDECSTTFESQLSGYVDYVSNLKLLYPCIELIQVRGLDYISDELLLSLDGIYWNGFKFNEYDTSIRLQDKMKLLNACQENFNWKIILVE